VSKRMLCYIQGVPKHYFLDNVVPEHTRTFAR